MNQAVADISVQLELRRAVQSEHSANESIVVGKDILELLSSAMYVDPLTLYREYVQNSADAIDDALDQGICRPGFLGLISIELDTTSRDIRIRDNGVGLPQFEAERLLTAFGASRKRGGMRRGFRGVGRLAGLGYGQFLTFHTKALGENVSTEVRWDCRKLKAILRDAAYVGNLGQVIRDVVTVRVLHSPHPDNHFFEVHIEKPIRVKNDVLLNEASVRSYIGQVAPLGFHDEFDFAREIDERLAPYRSKPRFSIRVNSSDAPLTRPFRQTFEVARGKLDRVVGYQWLEIKDSDNNPRAVGWVAEHGYLGAIQAAPELRGLRARVCDIQVGGEEVFAQIFPESRFNSWAIGELHILDRNVVPNGRRDNFEQNSAYHSLVSQLLPLGRAIAKRCRDSSARRNRLKKFEINEERVSLELAVLKQNALRTRVTKTVRGDIVRRLGEMESVVGGSLIVEQDREELSTRLAKLRTKLKNWENRTSETDPLSAVPPRKRAVYQEMIALIYECMPNRTAAKGLVDRLTARLAQS